MATFAPVTPQVTVARANNFIPELWSDEVIAALKSNLVVAPLIRKLSMKGKKGDKVHIPRPDRFSASAKVAETAVSLITDVNTVLDVDINQHFEYSRMIEDIADVQALSSMRRFYTDDAGYAMASNVDSSLLALGASLKSTPDALIAPGTASLLLGATWTGDKTWQPEGATGTLGDYDNGTTAITAFTDVTLRAALQKLDDEDVPMNDRFFVMPPSLVNAIRGIDRFNSIDFVNHRGVTSSEVGNLYGVDLHVTTNFSATVSLTGSVPVRMALLGHKDVYVLAEQVGVRTQTQYKQEHLSTLFTADRIYGRQIYRPECGLNIAVLA